MNALAGSQVNARDFSRLATPDRRFGTLEDMLAGAFEAIEPRERLSISQAAEAYHYVNLPGTHVGPFSFDKTPYLREPQDELSNLNYTASVYVGPARTGKSAMAINWLAATACTDAADMMFVHMTQATARDWSLGDLARMIRYSPEFAKRLTHGRQNDNVFDKQFQSGMRLLIKWPSITELSGKTIPRLWLFDYDRMPQDVDGEGNPFDLTRKRAQTFGRFGMCMAESSPGFLVQTTKWIPGSPHEAPPCEGILALYNRGDRRRWQWRCLQCGDPFEASFASFEYPDSADLMDASEQVTVPCPACGFPHVHDMKHELNMGGRWIKEGQTWLDDGTVGGTARRSDIASYWQKGPAAAFASWQQLVFKFLTAKEEFERTGSENALMVTVNVDHGEPYTPKQLEAGRLPEELKDRAEDWGGSAEYPVVPEGVRFLIKTVDVQARSFVVQTHGFTADGDVLLIELKKLRRSVLPDDNGEWQAIDPAARPEDWDVLIDELQQVYPLGDGSDRFMRIKLMGCDSGGADGVTANAKTFWRRLAEHGGDLRARFLLLKGDGTPRAPRLQISYPDGRKDKFAQARGDVPVWRIGSNENKDSASNMLGRIEPGGRVRFPKWAEDWLYTQLTTEIRSAKGWANPSRKRNEAWDLLVYAIALLLHRSVNFERINWANPPGWAAEWDSNDLVFSGNGEIAPINAAEEPGTGGLASLAERLA